jgi:hypothetical protein
MGFSVRGWLRRKHDKLPLARSEHSPSVLELLKGISLSPERKPGFLQEPTRMMDHYDEIDTHYQVGNVPFMAEVGSVSRNGPAPGCYTKQYRLHIRGGLKDLL